MLDGLISSHLVTPPSIWGKVPGHADMVSCGMRKGERAEWERWLSPLSKPSPGQRVPASASLPVAFVLPPGAMQFASKRFVVGVVVRSFDRCGRPHALVVYQLARRRWLRQHLASHADHPHDWLFWLARAVVRHAGLSEAADIRALERATDELWCLHKPTATDLLPTAWRPTADSTALVARSRALLDRLLGTAAPDDLARRLVGVRFLPWADWPERICQPRRPDRMPTTDGQTAAVEVRVEGAFWQQDDGGGFVNAAARLETLWSGTS